MPGPDEIAIANPNFLIDLVISLLTQLYGADTIVITTHPLTGR